MVKIYNAHRVFFFCLFLLFFFFFLQYSKLHTVKTHHLLKIEAVQNPQTDWSETWIHLTHKEKKGGGVVCGGEVWYNSPL